jgi:general secretion pathway protein D
MLRVNRLVAILVTATLVLPVVPLEARTRKGDRYFAEGARHQEKKEWDEALAAYEKALSEDPSDVAYMLATQKSRAAASEVHLENGLKVRAQGMLGEALVEFQRAFGLNPASSIAAQEIMVTQEMIDREKRRVQETGKESTPEDRALTPAEQAKKEIREKIDRMLPVPELKALNPERINLKMNNQPPKVLFETVAKVAGINVIWDPDYQPGKNLSIDLNNSTLEEALNDVAILTKSFWQALSENTIFVTNDNRNKRTDYEQQVLKVFYLSNVNTPQELQEIVNAVRAVTELTRLMPYNSQNAIIARGEADRIALAEKIINDLDKPKSEVVVDVMVMQVSREYSRTITAALANGTGLSVPVNFTPRTSIQVPTTTTAATTDTSTNTNLTGTGTTSTGTSTTPIIPLSNLGHIASSDFSITLPGALLQATLSDANTKILQSPEVRSVDNQKASLKIGQREPTATGSFQPGIGGVGINPLVNTQFTYIDVGVNLDLTPRVHDNNEVSMHVELDISNVANYINLGGIQQPVINQNKVIHDLRVREGEVSLLAGLTQEQENKTITGIPGLSSIPLLGRLFSGDTVDRTKSELMIALIPHIVRRPELTTENLRGISVGNQTSVKLNYAPRPEGPTVRSAAPAANTPVRPAVPPPTAPPATAPPATAPPAAPNAPGSAARVFFQPAQVDTTLSANLMAGLAVAAAADAATASFQVKFDPKVVRLNDVVLGDLFTQGGQQPAFTKNILNDAGTATVQLTRLPGTGGVSGGGVLLNFNMQAVGRGSSAISISNLTLQNSQGQIIFSGSPQLPVNVK